MQSDLLYGHQPLPTLEEVHLHFEQWRQQRRYSRQAIPESLWSEVALLKGRYPEGQIAQQLRLNRSQLKAKTSEHLSEERRAEFVEVSLPSSPEPQERCSLELHYPNGMTAQVKAINGAQLPNLLGQC